LIHATMNYLDLIYIELLMSLASVYPISDGEWYQCIIVGHCNVYKNATKIERFYHHNL
jgi:hypothetical protein